MNIWSLLSDEDSVGSGEASCDATVKDRVASIGGDTTAAGCDATAVRDDVIACCCGHTAHVSFVTV